MEIAHFAPDDPEDPRNWPRWKKWLMIGPILLIDLSVSWAASGYSPASHKFAEDMGVSSEVATLGLSLYVLGLAFGPMSLAPLSEYFGRRPIYIYSYGIFLLFLMATALAPSVGVFLVFRIFSGYFASVTIANFGGTIADLYHAHDTGPAMSLFLWAATCGSPSGFFLLSFVAQTHGWRTVFWALLGMNGSLWAIMSISLVICGETRHSILLAQRVEREHARGNAAISLPHELQKRGPRELFGVALTRPFRFLCTEPVIQFAALYNGYLYGLSFLFNTAFGLVFGPAGHGFDTIGVGLCFLGIAAGISIGPGTNIWQERYYQRKVREADGKNVPEARVQMGKLAACTFPLSLLLFAWTTSPALPAILPVLFSALWGWSFYTLILMSFTYTEDSYKTYSASALAGIGLIRNLAGAAFPLFARQLFVSLGYQWAGTVLAAAALLMVPIPFVLGRYGWRLRKASRWASAHVDDDGEGEGAEVESEGEAVAEAQSGCGSCSTV
ncbi:major facilitator superfamily domain-containing protein [Phyllosticta citriasiana]|uniref:major facilitator superfamily domain-containing protein n=1 Tax=Phyllosticta citriasiana TaxID=595635 RepID=UPI0030FD2C75